MYIFFANQYDVNADVHYALLANVQIFDSQTLYIGCRLPVVEDQLWCMTVEVQPQW